MAFVVSEAEHGSFRRAGNDLSVVASCSPFELLLTGAEIAPRSRRDRAEIPDTSCQPLACSLYLATGSTQTIALVTRNL